MAVPIRGAARTAHTSAVNNSGSLDPAQSVGGVYIDGGTLSESPAITTRLSPGNLSVGMRGQQLNTSDDGAFHTKLCNPAGSFAYGVSGKYIMIGGGNSQGTLAGVANTVLNNAGSNAHRGINFKVAQYGAATLTAHRAGYWRAGGVNVGSGTPQRTNWSTAPTPLTATYKDATGAGGDIDKAVRLTRAVPGHLFMLIDRTDWSQSSSGISEASPVDTGNFVQYAAKTG